MTKDELMAALRAIPGNPEVWVAVPGMLDARDHEYTVTSPVETVEVDGQQDIVLTGERS